MIYIILYFVNFVDLRNRCASYEYRSSVWRYTSQDDADAT